MPPTPARPLCAPIEWEKRPDAGGYVWSRCLCFALGAHSNGTWWAVDYRTPGRPESSLGLASIGMAMVWCAMRPPVAAEPQLQAIDGRSSDAIVF